MAFLFNGRSKDCPIPPLLTRKKMNQKTKIGSHTKKETNPSPNQRPWPNLPPQLLTLIALQPSLMQNITAFGGVTKSWRALTPGCRQLDGKPRWPQLIEINGPDNKMPQHSHKLNVLFHEEFFIYYTKRTRSYRNWQHGIYLRGHSHEQLVVMKSDFSECCLWEPASRCSHYLPRWDRNLPFKFATVPSSPNDWRVPFKSMLSPLPKNRYAVNVMVLTGISSPAFAFFRWNNGQQEGWIIENCKVIEPYSSNQHMLFTNAIGFEGKFYAISLQGSLAVIQDKDSSFQITAIGANRAVPSKVSRQFREYLLEYNLEILLVLLISRKSINAVDDAEVFRLHTSRLSSEKVESLGDAMLFVENECCMGLSAGVVGCRGNCIYFTHHRANNWWVFDMETSCISPTSGPEIELTKSPMWIS